MENVADVYPLTPMQEVMLLHSLSSGATDTLFSQFNYELKGDLDAQQFVSAWQALVDRHAALRTIFLWEGLKKPMQVVRAKLDLPYQIEDWRGLAPNTQAQQLNTYFEQNRGAGFDPTVAPLMRIALFRLTDDRHIFVWSSHHLILDRWCIGTLFNELASLYAAPGTPLPGAAVQYRDYISWLSRQNPSTTRAYWREYLSGLEQTTAITRYTTAAGSEHLAQTAELTIQPELSHSLVGRAQSAGLTLGSLVQLAWAMLMNRYCKQQDIVFGAAVSGRPPDLENVEEIIGSFVCNVPVRFRLGSDSTIAELASELQRQQLQRVAHEYLPSTDLHEVVDLPGEAVLFDTLFVWLTGTPGVSLGGVEVCPQSGALATAYPLTVCVADQPQGLLLQVTLKPGHHTGQPLSELLAAFQDVLGHIERMPLTTQLADFPAFLGDRPRASWQPASHPLQAGQQTVADTSSAPINAGREHAEDAMIRSLVEHEWRKLLDLHTPAADADFFELGGNSLSAVSLHAALEAGLRKEIPMIALFQHATINTMVDFLASNAWPLKAEMITPLRRDGAAEPLFCIASPEVNTLGYTLLARHLQVARPVYVIQAPPDSEAIEKISVADIPAIAQQYLAAIRSVYADGPIQLLGTCTGAHLTLEMGRIIEQEGGRLSFVAIINTWAMYTVARTYHIERFANRLRWYRSRLVEVAHMSTEQRNQYLTDYYRRLLGRVPAPIVEHNGAPAINAAVTQVPIADAEADEENDEWIENVGWAHLNSEAQINPVHTPITVFRIKKQQWWRTSQPGLGWERNTTAGVRIVNLPGRQHLDILREPQVRLVAAKLDQELEQANMGGIQS